MARFETLFFPAIVIGMLACHPASAADAPALSGATKVESQPKGEGTHTYYTSTESAMDLVKSYSGTLTDGGWTITSSGGGGGGGYGGGGGLTASKGEAYLVMTAGGGEGKTSINLCVWPKRPANDEC